MNDNKELIQKLKDNPLLLGKVCMPHAFTKPFASVHYDLKNIWLDKTQRKVCIEAPRGIAKCLSEDTEIYLVNGIRKKIKDINIGDKVLSLNKNKFEEDTIVAKINSGIKEVIEITTKTRKSIVCSKEHKILTFDGWKEAKDITINDYIAAPRYTLNIENIFDKSDAEVKFIAYLIAEGSLSSGNCKFTNNDKVIIDDFISVCNELGFKVRKVKGICYTITKGINSPRELLRKNNLLEHTAYNKRIPEWIYLLPKRQKYIFLAALWDTDGWFTKDLVGITLANKELIKDIQVLLWQLGINSYYAYRDNDKAGAWALYVDKHYLHDFITNIPLILKKDKALKILEKKRYSLLDVYPNKIKKNFPGLPDKLRKNKIARLDNKYSYTREKIQKIINYFPYDKLVELENSSIFWDKVEKIEQIGERKTYDIQVAKNKNIISNGLITHNSTIVGCLFVIHHILFEPGTKFVVLVSRTNKHTERLLATIKDVFEYSQPFRSVFGYWGQHSAHKWGVEEVWLKDNSLITTRGTGQQIVGMKHLNQRPTLIIYDDPEDDNNTKTPEAMDANLSILLKGAVPALDIDRGRIWVIGTPQNERCMTRKLKEMSEKPNSSWKYYHYSAITDWEKKEVLWKEYMSFDELMAEKAEYEAINRLSLWYSERMCEIRGDETQLFKEEYIQYYDYDYIQINGESYLTDNNEKIIPVECFMGVDPATSLSNKADYTAIVCVAVDKEGNRYVLPYVRKRMPPSETIETIIREFKKYNCVRISLETTGSQEVFRDILSKLENVFLPGINVKHNPKDKKEKRYVDVLEPFFFKRKIFLKKDMEELKDELLLFPRAKHDDCIKENALIKTIDGYKEVKYIKEGDLVLTHLGRYKKVKKVIKKEFDGKFCTLKPKGQLELEVSTDHKIYYASKMYSKDGVEQYYPGYEKRGWIEAEKFKKTYKNVFIVEMLNENSNYEYVVSTNKYANNEKLNKLILDKEFAKILGYFLAEGNAYKGKGHTRRFCVSFASHIREYGKRNFVKKYFSKFGISIKEVIEGNSAMLIFDNKFFHTLFSECYDDNKEKILPSFAYKLGKDLKYTLIWWMAGDGWTIKRKFFLNGNILKSADRYCGTTSKKLVLAMRDIAFSCGWYATIRKLKRYRYNKQTKDFYQFDLYFKKPLFSKITELSLFERGSSVAVKDIQDYKGYVYDLQIEDDFSFVCNGFVIHNCLDALYYAVRKSWKPQHEVVQPTEKPKEEIINWKLV